MAHDGFLVSLYNVFPVTDKIGVSYISLYSALFYLCQENVYEKITVPCLMLIDYVYMPHIILFYNSFYVIRKHTNSYLHIYERKITDISHYYTNESG